MVSSGLDTYARVRHCRVVATVPQSGYYTALPRQSAVASNKSGPALARGGLKHGRSVVWPGIMHLHRGAGDVGSLVEERHRFNWEPGGIRRVMTSLPIRPNHRSVVTPQLRSGVTLRDLIEREGEGS